MTTNELLEEIRDTLLEQTEEIFSNDQLLRYANRTKDDIAKRLLTKDLITKTTLAFTSGVATLPSDFESFYSAGDQDIVGTGNNFGWYSAADFNNADFDYGIGYDNGQLNVYPTTTGTLYMRYYKTLADMTVGSTPTLPTYTHDLIIDGSLARAFEKTQDFELAQYYEAKYERRLKQKQEVISYSEEGAQKGGQMFRPQNLIN